MKTLGTLSVIVGLAFSTSLAPAAAPGGRILPPPKGNAVHKAASPLPSPPAPKVVARPINRPATGATLPPKQFLHQVPYRRSPALPAIGGAASGTKKGSSALASVGGPAHPGAKPAGTLDGSHVKRKP